MAENLDEAFKNLQELIEELFPDSSAKTILVREVDWLEGFVKTQNNVKL